jgi:hypothetical protein
VFQLLGSSIITVTIILQLAEVPDRDVHLISAVDRPEYSHCCVFMLALCLTCGILADFTLDHTTNRHSLRYSPCLVIIESCCGAMSLRQIYLITSSYLSSCHLAHTWVFRV